MNANHVLRIRDSNAVNTLREFLSAWWPLMELDMMLAPVELPDHGGVAPEVIEHPDEVWKVNPFLPMMPANCAPMVDGFIRAHPGNRLAVMLRPCELRALVELRKRSRVQVPLSRDDGRKSLVIIGVDCTGALSPAEYARHVEGHHSDAEIIRAALAYGSQEKCAPLQVRVACQMCDSPAPFGADVVIGSIGAASQGYLLVITSDEKTDASLKLSDITDGKATEAEAAHREMMVGKLAGERSGERLDLINKQAAQTNELNGVMATFARCTLCADCLDACPLYDGELTGMLGVSETQQRTHPLLTELVNVSRWMASCPGCGMCQDACEHGVSLMPIVLSLSQHIQHELHYKPGDPNRRLPWTV